MGLLGTKLLGWSTVGYVEKDDYCQRIIAQRIKDGVINNAPIFSDVKTFISDGYAGSYKNMVDVITAGFPCQPFSRAYPGRQNEHDERNLWPQTIETIRIVKPRFFVLENVEALTTTTYFRNTILTSIVESGYDCQWDCLPAHLFGAASIRSRLFLVAHADGERCNAFKFHGAAVSHSTIEKTASEEAFSFYFGKFERGNGGRVFRKPDAGILGMVNDDPDRLDRLKAVGNGQVPAVVKFVCERIK